MDNFKIEPVKREHFKRILELIKKENWPSYLEDEEKTWQAITNKGVTTLVALLEDTVVGFIVLLSDGHIQSFMNSIIVDEKYRRKGIGKALVREAQADPEKVIREALAKRGK